MKLNEAGLARESSIQCELGLVRLYLSGEPGYLKVFAEDAVAALRSTPLCRPLTAEEKDLLDRV